jgi:hypothetical protein
MASRKEPGTTTTLAPREPVPITRTDFLLALLLGAVAAVLVLMLLNFGTRNLWSPFSQRDVGATLFRSLIISGLVSGVTATLALRGLWQPHLRMVPPAACALGWGVFGLLQHATQSETFFHILPQSAHEQASRIFWTGAPWQALCVACGLLAAMLAAWFLDTRILTRLRPTPDKSMSATEDESSGTAQQTFRRSLGSPVMTAIPGFFVLSVAGLALYATPQLNAAQLPAPFPRALLAAMVSVLAFAIGAFGARRLFRGGGTASYLMGAPLTVAFISALFVAAGGQMSILLPAASTLWNSSAFEVASWGAFGGALGFWLAGEVPNAQDATTS